MVLYELFLNHFDRFREIDADYREENAQGVLETSS